MDAYRAALCTFCNDTAAETCPRCEVAVCASHGLSGHEHCAICRKERDDELEIAQFAAVIHQEEPRWDGKPSEGEMIGDLSRALHDLFAPRKRERTFAQRTPADIAEWRRTAGIKMR